MENSFHVYRNAEEAFFLHHFLSLSLSRLFFIPHFFSFSPKLLFIIISPYSYIYFPFPPLAPRARAVYSKRYNASSIIPLSLSSLAAIVLYSSE